MAQRGVKKVVLAYSGGRLIVLVVLGALAGVPAMAKPVRVEFLQATITLANAVQLRALACRNFDHIVHVDIAVTWPKANADVETDGFERLIFWDDKAEYLFAKGSFTGNDGVYAIAGYFMVRDGGMHAGMISDAFMALPAGTVMPNPDVVETKVTSSSCRHAHS